MRISQLKLFLAGKSRQWGTERSTKPLPILHEKPSSRKLAFARLAIILTILLWLAYVINTIVRQSFEDSQNFQLAMQSIGYLVVVTSLSFSTLMYLLARLGALQRFSKHNRVPRAEIDEYFANKQPSVSVIVPSYDEEPDVIRKTLLSAVLQEYPDMRVVLLLDDKPYPTNPETLARLERARQIGQEISTMLSQPRRRFQKALRTFEKTSTRNRLATPRATKKVAEEYAWAAKWLQQAAKKEAVQDHTDTFFVEQVLSSLADELQLISQALQAAATEKSPIPRRRLHQLYRRLAWTFSAEVDVFERKKYASLSHEANKAMNLNSYISLMGGSYNVQETPDGQVLISTKGKQKSDLIVPDSDYVLTLDADSILLREYCLRLVHFMDQPANERVAVAQTPYSSFRGAPTRIERVASATTDVQHILHQGMTQYNATFWVGANAIIRKRALNDIVEIERIGGFEIKKFIQDRTVIEDTESSVDIGTHGWTLYNYPERLSYSATPPDFGSLIVQRRRWANGGLIILPKFWQQIREFKRQQKRIAPAEIFLRLNYMASIAWASFGLLFLLTFPYDSRLLSPLIVLAALPYFLSMASDLKYCGYKRTDVIRIYGFNLILLAVNLAGVLKSLQQALSGKKIPFARTPKVKDRTVAPAIYVLAPLLIVAFSILTFIRDYNVQNWGNATFAAINALLTLWAAIAFIGIRNTFADLWRGLTDWMYVEVKPEQSASESNQPVLDWRAVLYHGDNSARVPLKVVSQELVSEESPRGVKK